MFLWCTTNTSTHSLWISVFVNTGDVFYFSQSMKETLKVFSIASKSFVKKMFLVADNVQTTTVSPFRLSPLRESEKKNSAPVVRRHNFFFHLFFLIHSTDSAEKERLLEFQTMFSACATLLKFSQLRLNCHLSVNYKVLQRNPFMLLTCKTYNQKLDSTRNEIPVTNK